MTIRDTNHSMSVKRRNPWNWIPTLYFAEGLPYVAVMTIAVIMYKRLGLSNTEITLYTSWLYLPWTIKPLWSPFVDLVKTKRSWIIAMQGLIAAGFAGIAFFIPTTHFVQLTLAFFWLMAFSSATHDIAADGFYMLGLNNKEQSFFRRYPKYILSFCQYLRTRYSRHARRMARNLTRQHSFGLEYHFLSDGRIISCSHPIPPVHSSTS